MLRLHHTLSGGRRNTRTRCVTVASTVKGVADGLLMLMLMNLAVHKRFNCRIFDVKWMVHVGTGKIERRPYAVIDGYVDLRRYKRKREQTTNEKKGI